MRRQPQRSTFLKPSRCPAAGNQLKRKIEIAIKRDDRRRDVSLRNHRSSDLLPCPPAHQHLPKFIQQVADTLRRSPT